MSPWVVRVVLPAAVLGFYCWSFVVRPVVATAPAATPVAVSPEAARVDGAVAPGPPSVDELRRLTDEAERLYRAGSYEAALVPLIELQKRTPNSEIVVRRLAGAYGHLGRPREAAEMWEQFLALSPTPKDACPALPRVYEAQNLADKALDAYERCYKIEPSDVDLVFYFALACERRGDAARARKLYQAALALQPDYADVSAGLARLALRAGDLATASKAAAAAVKAAPSNVDALLVAAQVAMRQGRTTDARSYLTRALELDPVSRDAQALRRSLGLVK